MVWLLALLRIQATLPDLTPKGQDNAATDPESGADLREPALLLLFPRRIHISREKQMLVNQCRCGVMPGIFGVIGWSEPGAEAEIATAAPRRALQDKAEKPITGMGRCFPDAVGFTVWAPQLVQTATSFIAKRLGQKKSQPLTTPKKSSAIISS